MNTKLISPGQLSEHVKQIHSSEKSIVLVGGCFDILHRGHVEFLQRAGEHGDVLLVFLESDGNVKMRKGEGRPINSQMDRARLLSKVGEVDGIILLPDIKLDNEYFELVKSIEPDIIGITEGDPYADVIQHYANKVKAKLVEVTPRIEGYSTQGIIERAKNL